MEKAFCAATRKPFQSTKISRFTSKNLHVQLKTYRVVQEIPLKFKKELVKYMDVCTQGIAMLIFPRVGEALYEVLLAEKCTGNAIMEGMLKVLLKEPKGSVDSVCYVRVSLQTFLMSKYREG